MRALTPAAIAASKTTTTRPLFLVEIGWDPISRLSSGPGVVWAGYSWTAVSRLEVAGLVVSGDGYASASLTLGNTTGVFGALALNTDISDTPVRIWQADSRVLDAADPILMFDGVIDGTSIALDLVTLRLATQRTARQVIPATVIGPASGFNVLLPAGSRITVGGVTTILTR